MHELRTSLIVRGNKYADFAFYLCPTFDFKQELLAQGREVEVLEPASMREDMMRMLVDAMGRYGLKVYHNVKLLSLCIVILNAVKTSC